MKNAETVLMQSSVQRVDMSPIWDALMEIYKVFSSICEKHNLRHYVTDGSAIGAVRHNGFIPWDDDLDVSMPRPDYNKFMEIASKELPSNLVAYDRHQCPEMKVLFGKVQEVRAEKVHEVEKQVGRILAHGLYIDIFPIDGCPSSIFEIGLVKVRYLLLLGIQRYRCNTFLCYSIKGRLMWILGWLCAHMFSSLSKIKNIDDVLNAKEALVGCYSYDDSNNTVRLPNFINRLIIFNKSVWGEGVKVPFASSHVVLPTMFDSYLRAAFGDYMKLPPEDKRYSTHVVKEYLPWWLGPTMPNKSARETL